MLSNLKKKELYNLLMELKDKHPDIYQKLINDPTIYTENYKEFALLKLFAMANNLTKQDLIKLIVDFKNGLL